MDDLQVGKIFKAQILSVGKCPACESRNVAWTLLQDNSPQYKLYHGECKDCKCSFDINSL